MVKLNAQVVEPAEERVDPVEGAQRARLYEPGSPRHVDVWFEITEQGTAQVRHMGLGRTQSLSIEEYPNRIAGVADRLTVQLSDEPSGKTRRLEFMTPLPPDLVLPGQAKSHSWLSFMERRPARYAVVLLALAVVAFFIYRFALGFFIDIAVAMIPRSFEQEITASAFDWAGDEWLAKPSQPYRAQQMIMDEAVRDFSQLDGLDYVPKVLIRDMPGYGANAFAFPGGPIVVTEELLLLEPSNAALRGLMAHEYVHVAQRHSLKQMVRVVGILTLSSMVFGADGMSPDELIALALPVIEGGLSRRYESEADILGQKLLAEAGYDPGGMAQVLKLLQADCHDDCLDLGLLSTHPSFERRLQDLGAHHDHGDSNPD